jgi:hypothetical protein
VRTILILTIEHKKPLPTKAPITDVVSERIYNYLYAQGVEASVRASIAQEKAEPWEQDKWAA